MFAGSILVYGGLILVMALLRGVFLFLMRQTIIVMSRHIEYDQKNEIFAHYQSLSASFYLKNNTGDLMARISEDVSKVRMYTGPAIMYGINLITLFVLVIGYMLSVNVKLTLYSLLPLPVLSVSIFFVNGIINTRSERIQRSLSALSSYAQEAFSGIRVLKAFVKEEHSASAFEKESNLYRAQSLALNQVNALFFPLILALIGFSTILTVWVGGLEVIKGNISTGHIAEFVIYINMLTWPATSLGWITSLAQRAAASQERINEFLFEKSDIVSDSGICSILKGAIRFENVSFRYEGASENALTDISFNVPVGSTIAILGSTGSGKSTLSYLISRLYDPSSGSIFIDQLPAKDYNVACMRRQIGVVPQDVFLFSDTIANNIRFGSGPDMSLEKIQEASRIADLDSNVSQFPNGYQTITGERGITLSGGQKQRVSIARAIAMNTPILVLDDCLSAVDTATENTILDNMQKMKQSRTMVVISHRVSSAKLADTIIVLEKGKIVAQGSHQELIVSSTLYKTLYEKQSKE